MSKLTRKRCTPCEGGVLPLAQRRISAMLKEIPEWRVNKKPIEQIYRIFQFENYYQTIAFVNAVAWVANQEDHHPRLEVEYNNCTVRYWTHAINALSENDFICAAKINNLYKCDEIRCSLMPTNAFSEKILRQPPSSSTVG